ncbi:MAG TPA: proline--tRNA ligase [Acidimicrobiales bacterium]|nr:proline--tRNA ligase [Acidimicrobiales bacterium]
MAEKITPRGDDYSQWYLDVIRDAQLAENSPVRGCMVIRPYGFALWEHIRDGLDRRFKETGHVNAYFPLFIPLSFFEREAEHVEGFAKECAVVTHHRLVPGPDGGLVPDPESKLTEPLIVRPTSETIIGDAFKNWVQSYRDLPLLINQWANVVRWELRPRLFLRTTEFLWQEGHTCHATEADAKAFALNVLAKVYEETIRDVLSIPSYVGRKSERERFPGATATWTIEAMMGDGKALQMCTSHELGQNFGRAFDTTFATAEGGTDYVWQTSWGFTTRVVGALIMSHGDDRGLRLPPSVAPTQCVVIVVKADGSVADVAASLVKELASNGVRVKLDDRADVAFGRRSVDHELKGIPVRVEIGPRDLAEGNVTVVRRDTGGKSSVAVTGAAKAVADALVAVQASLFEQAKARLAANTADCATLDEAVETAKTGFALIPGRLADDEGEDTLNQNSLSVRCLRRPDGSLPEASDPLEDLVAVVARSY